MSFRDPENNATINIYYFWFKFRELKNNFLSALHLLLDFTHSS